MSGVPGDSNLNGIPDITEEFLGGAAKVIKRLGKHTVHGTGESITTSDEQQGPQLKPKPGSQIID